MDNHVLGLLSGKQQGGKSSNHHRFSQRNTIFMLNISFLVAASQFCTNCGYFTKSMYFKSHKGSHRLKINLPKINTFAKNQLFAKN